MVAEPIRADGVVFSAADKRTSALPVPLPAPDTLSQAVVDAADQLQPVVGLVVTVNEIVDMVLPMFCESGAT